jgi:polyhydroxybutyrate depolymerase
MRVRIGWLLCLVFWVGGAAHAAPLTREWVVDGVKREALIFLPTTKTDAPAPLVFGFHGHGGSSQNAARSFRLHELWPEAIVVYPQGLKTVGQLTDPNGERTGWQGAAGILGDRDLKFFDALLATLVKEYRVNERQVFCTGHSNGGGFTYLLWAERGRAFAAMAPSAAASRSVQKLVPKPAMHVAGKSDPLVKYSWQRRMMDSVKQVNRCSATGVSWAKDCMMYPSATGTPLVEFIHNGAHKYPDEAPALIVRFFKEQAAKP